jgi:hypothetical protein
MGYLGTWSAAQRYQATKGEDPVELISKELTEAWGEPQQLKTIEWPMTLKVGINA